MCLIVISQRKCDLYVGTMLCVGLIAFIAVFLAANYLVQGEFQTTPENACARVGERVELFCSVQGEHIQLWKDPSNVYIAQNEDVEPKFDDLYQIFGSYNLRIPDISFNEAGLYTCEDSSGSSSQKYARAEVIVLGDAATMTSSVAGDLILEDNTITYTCKVRYERNIVPAMEWKSSLSSEIIPHLSNNAVGMAETSITIPGAVKYNGDSFVCRIFFDAPATSDSTIATNAPDCSMEETSAPLSVHYGPRDTDITTETGESLQSGATVKVGQTLSCKSNCNPPVRSYEWHILKDSEYQVFGQSQTVTLQPQDEGVVGLRCTVTNYMGRTFDTEATNSVDITVDIMDDVNQDMTEKNDTSEGLSGGAIAGIVLGVLLGLAAICGVVIFVLYKCRCQTKTPEDHNIGVVSNPTATEVTTNEQNTGEKCVEFKQREEITRTGRIIRSIKIRFLNYKPDELPKDLKRNWNNTGPNPLSLTQRPENDFDNMK